ncbi:AcrR family transcriptional regulator [Streptosporangium becharense]|uniref:AcrR family transcriptional regulator n=1 Tax=Streptosporangium becharense TaxID=1816182 RepID=A0A7W9IJM7_9ACTN|nr:TetR family transcriptional regulator [Streptosporangium becharense]MBB2911015.1 AcrR family transcriptional regulator [Streptosporangium becharense]MBB5821927.1 AcrR family transcriptional regulator [Streptosporangium becharense]
MGRPSLAGQRREQILKAAARSVARYGLAGSTQERIAAAAGMSRSHIRHYLGNRDQLLDALWDHVITPYFTAMHSALADRVPEARLRALVDFLFGPQMARNEDDLVIEAFISGAMHDVRLRGRIYDSYSRLEREIAGTIRTAIPDCDSAESLRLAYALICMAFGHSTLAPLPFPVSRHAGVKTLATQLLAAFRTDRAGPPPQDRAGSAPASPPTEPRSGGGRGAR